MGLCASRNRFIEGRLHSSCPVLGGRDTEQRMHRFATFIEGAAPGPPLGPMSDPNCVTSASWPAAVILSCDNHRLVRRFR